MRQFLLLLQHAGASEQATTISKKVHDLAQNQKTGSFLSARMTMTVCKFIGHICVVVKVSESRESQQSSRTLKSCICFLTPSFNDEWFR